MYKKALICAYILMVCIFSQGTTHAQTSLEDRIPDAIEALHTYSKNNNIPLSYVRHDLLEMIEDMPNKKNKNILKMVNMDRELEIITAYDKPAWFEVDGNIAYMYGKIDSTIYTKAKELMDVRPNLEKIIMVYVPGSHDDFTNFEAIKYLRKQNIILEI
jgi:hypothetical protein